MQQTDKIKQYADSVCEQIRWKKAHNVIKEEIENHITDQQNAFIAAGYNEQCSTDKAIAEMGDPITVGSQLDRTHRPKIEWSMILLTLAALLVGIAVNFFVKSTNQYIDELYYFHRTIIVNAVGVIFLIAAYFMDFSIIGKYPKIIFALFVAFMLFFIFLPYAHEINGAKRWIHLPVIGAISVSSLLLLIPTFYAGIIYSMRNKGYTGIILCGVYYVTVMLVLVFSGQGIGSILTCTLTCLILLLATICYGCFNVKRLYGVLLVVVPTIGLLILLVFSVFINAYRIARFTAFLAPYSDPQGAGYLTILIRRLIQSANFIGQGIQPHQYTQYTEDAASLLPSVNTDYVITYLIHKVGWIAFAAILLLLLGFVVRGFYLCFKQKSILGKLVSTSVLLTFTFQMISYIGANLGSQLFYPFSLPLISYGGTSAVINLFLIGLMLSVFKSGDLLRDKTNFPSGSDLSHKFFEFADGKIIIDFKAAKRL